MQVAKRASLVPANYQAVFELANDIMVIHDKDSGEILDANLKAREIYGHSLNELQEMTIGQLTRNSFPYDTGEGVRKVREAARSPQGILFEWVIINREGAEISVEVSLRPIVLDHVTRVLAIARDITDRKRAQLELLAKERYYRRLIERSADGVAVLGESGDVRFVGPSIQALLGIPSRFLAGRSAFDFLPPDATAQFRELFASLRPTEDRTEIFHLYHRDGGKRIFEARCRDLRKDRAVNGVLINFRDVTERVEAEARLHERERQFSHVARLSTTGEMAAALAHELNQPFFSILNFVAGCRRQIESGRYSEAPMLEALRFAQHEAERAGRIIRTVRSFTCNGEYQRQVVDVRAIVKDALQLIELRAKHARVRVRHDMDEQACWANCDEVLVKQVLVNLAVNGIESIEQADSDRKEVNIVVCKYGAAQVKISISDTGQGLPKVSPDKMTDAFFSTKRKGLGVGLALSRSIVTSHGGHFWATRPNSGETRFHVLLPGAASEIGFQSSPL